MSAARRHATLALGRFGLAVHGGAGTIERADMGGPREARQRAALARALTAGYALLREGASALDAVAAAVLVLEDSPLFNAGRGAAFNADGRHELDAAIADGATLAAGSVAALRRARNPVLVARAVMQHTPHVMLAGPAADRFARRRGLALMPAAYFATARRRRAWLRGRVDGGGHGTVGAVALDRAGNLAAATSTGGTTGKLAGRVGDSPIVGAGVYADNSTCAVSATGTGEYFIRTVAAHDIAARMRYRGESLAEAAHAVLARIARLGGAGGVIALDRRGRLAMPFNSAVMYRGSVGERARLSVAIYR